jgi:hypothetical protein
MNPTMLRTLQAGAALLIVAAVALAVLVVSGALDREQALAAGRDIGLLLVLCTGACCALIALLGLGRRDDG